MLILDLSLCMCFIICKFLCWVYHFYLLNCCLTLTCEYPLLLKNTQMFSITFFMWAVMYKFLNFKANLCTVHAFSLRNIFYVILINIDFLLAKNKPCPWHSIYRKFKRPLFPLIFFCLFTAINHKKVKKKNKESNNLR